MVDIKKQFIVDENNNKVAVQLDIETYEKLETLLEDFALAQFINENKEEDNLNLKDAKDYYQNLKKVN